MKKGLILVIIATLFPFPSISGWWPFSSNNESVKVNTYFYFPNGKEVFLGQHIGAASCQSAAINYAYSQNIGEEEWDYICCTIEKGSSCYKKIR